MNETGSHEPLHLEADDLASYLDRRLDTAERDRVEGHLALCPECRSELAAVAGILETQAPGRRRWLVLGPAVAAAAIAVILLWPEADSRPTSPPVHRDQPGIVEPTPVLVSPLGATPNVETLEWSGVLGADRYRVTLFDDSGSVLWRSETTATSIALPDSVALEANRLFLWQVGARVAIDRWIESDLGRFSIQPPFANPLQDVRPP